MTDETVRAFACAHCGGTIQRVPYEPEVTCSFCGKPQMNKLCLVPDDEVMVSGQQTISGLALGRVRVLAAADDVTVDVDGRERHVHLDDLVPVVRARGVVKNGMRVYARLMTGWVRTWASSDVDGGSLRVKHEGAAFQDSFFDEQVDENNVRVDARPSERPKRSAKQAFMARFKSDPAGTLIKGGVSLVFLIVGLFFALLFGSMIYFAIFN